jgi:dTDP-4-amino-4,6-dideoxygalactose transaminase
MNIPMVDLKEQYKVLKKEIDSTVLDIMASGWFIMGPRVQEFEEAAAEYCQTRFAVGCASGTDALMMALMAIDIRPGDEIITTPFTFAATAEVIRLLGAKAVFVDVRPDDYNIDTDKIRGAVTEKTRAIIPVHLYGQTADMDPISEIAAERGLVMIEDACQAIGARYKEKRACSMGHMGCLSFFPAKNLGAFGDGGMVLTSDETLLGKLRMIRDHGSDRRYHHAVLGLNSRLDALQAGILHVKLKHIEEWNEARRDRAALYSELLKTAKVGLPVIRETNDHVFHQYTIRVKDRGGLQKHLGDAGIATAIHYPVPLHLQPAFQEPGVGEGSFPVAEEAARQVISLPMYPELKEEAIETIAKTIVDFTG